MTSYRSVREIRVFRQDTDAHELSKALLIFSRNTSTGHRTLTNQILFKFANPNNPHGTFFYVGLYEDGDLVGMAMFGYYPRRRVVVFDHLTIAADRRKHCKMCTVDLLKWDLCQRHRVYQRSFGGDIGCRPNCMAHAKPAHMFDACLAPHYRGALH